VHRALANGGTDELLDDIDRRITSTVLRHSLFAAARDVAHADDELDADEESLLVQVAARFA
jgi:tellurite resistance protein